MFEKYFGLDENPFNLTPDPKYLFFSDVHKEALSHLKYGIDERKGFILITGEVGAGKTTLCRLLLTTLPSTIKTGLILNPSLSDIELLQTINQEFGIASTYDTKKALLDELNNFLLNIRSKGDNAVLIIDECQNLSPDALEQIRMLSNLETEKEKLLQIVLIGQPELKIMLATPRLKQINDRITVRYHMGLLNKSDTKDYINHRLIVSGSHGDIKFTRGAVDEIYKFSSGLPRRINSACERSLLIAFTKGTNTITGNMAKQSIKEVTGDIKIHTPYKKIMAAVSLAAVAVTAFFLYQPLLTLISNNTGIAGVHENSLPKVTVEKIPAKKYSWVINDYRKAFDSLKLLPGMENCDSILNLHPSADFLINIKRPLIASVWGGYCIIKQIKDNNVEIYINESNQASLPFEEFSKIYQGHAVAVYKKNPVKETFSISSRNPAVKEIQEKLLSIDYISIIPDGVYGIETADGIEKLQEICGLKKDGIAGSETLALINIIGGSGT